MKQKKVKEEKTLKLNLASGDNPAEGFLNVDITKLPTVDKVVNLEKFPWPWKDNSVDEVICSHYVEHTPDLIKFMEELYRILKPGAKAFISCPYYSSMRCWQDPTHKRAMSEASMLYFNKGWRDSNKLAHYGITADFDFSYSYAMDPIWAQKSEEARAFAIRHYNNVVNDIQYILVKKDGS